MTLANSILESVQHISAMKIPNGKLEDIAISESPCSSLIGFGTRSPMKLVGTQPLAEWVLTHPQPQAGKEEPFLISGCCFFFPPCSL